jgi:hypothetical protein
MQRYLLTLFALILISIESFGQIPPLQAGVPYYYTLGSLTMIGDASCTPKNYTVIVSPVPLATGVNWKMVVDSLTGNIVRASFGPINLNDTLPAYPPDGMYDFQADPSSRAYLRFFLDGTPTVSLESYPCYFNSSISFPNCGLTWSITPDTDSAQCNVGTFSGLGNVWDANAFRVFYSAGAHRIKISSSLSSNEDFTFSLYDIAGKSICSKTLPQGEVTFFLQDVNTGLYLWQITNGNRQYRGKLIIPD